MQTLRKLPTVAPKMKTIKEKGMVLESYPLARSDQVLGCTLAFKGNFSGRSIISVVKSTSKSGQKKWPGEGSSMLRIFRTGASLNHGKSS